VVRSTFQQEKTHTLTPPFWEGGERPLSGYFIHGMFRLIEIRNQFDADCIASLRKRTKYWNL